MMRAGMTGSASDSPSAMSGFPPLTDGESEHRTGDTSGERADDGGDLEVEQPSRRHAAPNTIEHDAPCRRRPPQPAEHAAGAGAAVGQRLAARLVEVIR